MKELGCSLVYFMRHIWDNGVLGASEGGLVLLLVDLAWFEGFLHACLVAGWALLVIVLYM